LLDEPLSALDLKLRKAMQIELKQIQRETGITFIFVTHDQEEALTMSDRIAVMSAGELQQLGAPRDIYEQPCNMFVANFIGETNLLAVSVDKITQGRALCHIGGGHELTTDAVDGVAAGAKVHLSVRPERMILSDQPSDGESLKGTVTENIFIGTDITTMMDLDGGPKITIRTSNTERGNKRLIEQGNTAFVTMETGAARLLVD
jgi:spermidine/putrescine transport system ATP-binding protein